MTSNSAVYKMSQTDALTKLGQSALSLRLQLEIDGAPEFAISVSTRAFGVLYFLV